MANVTSPWLPVDPLDDVAFAQLRRRAIFDCCKWDPQVGDHCAISRHPLVITRAAWDEVVSLAEALARETVAAETEIVHRPDLQERLRLPRAIRQVLKRAPSAGASRGALRLIRFDFHYTSDGWRISEANCDVPGGLNEASGLPLLFAPHYSGAAPVGDPVARYVESLAALAGPAGTVAFVHATAYSDDQQMMSFVARRLEAAGLSAHLASPSHIRWRGRTAHLEAEWWRGPLDLIVRFFPAEWLSGLPNDSQWAHFFVGADTPLSNPATALVTQTKRFPLIWDALRTPLPTWRALLPETRDPRDAPWTHASDEWIVKPALGRVGEDIGMRDVVQAKDMRRIARSVRWWPSAWVAQRRFQLIPTEVAGVPVFPCLGVYTLDARVVGAYARLARLPLVDSRAADAAVLAA
jgi:glutathionylspermidine synthase